MPRTRTPAATIQAHLAASAKTARLARAIIEQRLLEIQSDLRRPNLPKDEKAKLLLQAVEVLQVLNHGIDQSARSLLKPATTQPVPTADEISAQQVMDDLIRGLPRSGSPR
jgi:hypothetical protein